MRSKGSEASKKRKQVARLTVERQNLLKALEQGGDPELLNPELAQNKKELADAQAVVDRFAAASVNFEIDPPSIEHYLKLVDQFIARVHEYPVAAKDAPLVEELNELVDRVVVYPNENDRGFEVEVVGKLAKIVAGTDSFCGKFSAPNNIVRGLTLTAEHAANQLRIVLPRFAASPTNPLCQTIEKLLSNDWEPVSAADIQQRLAAAEIKATKLEIERAIQYGRSSFVIVRRGWVMARTAYERLPIRYFTTTEAILEMAEDVLYESPAPLGWISLMEEFLDRGWVIHGECDQILRTALSASPQFEVASLQPTLWMTRRSKRTAASKRMARSVAMSADGRHRHNLTGASQRCSA